MEYHKYSNIFNTNKKHFAYSEFTVGQINLTNIGLLQTTAVL